VTFSKGLVADGSKKVFLTLSEAQQAVRTNRGGQYKAVRAAT